MADAEEATAACEQRIAAAAKRGAAGRATNPFEAAAGARDARSGMHSRRSRSRDGRGRSRPGSSCSSRSEGGQGDVLRKSAGVPVGRAGSGSNADGAEGSVQRQYGCGETAAADVIPMLDVAGRRGRCHKEVGRQLAKGKQRLGEVLRHQRRVQAAALLEESKQVGGEGVWGKWAVESRAESEPKRQDSLIVSMAGGCRSFALEPGPFTSPTFRSVEGYCHSIACASPAMHLTM